tara:strand:+ start:65 stop:661 length:597 start_codon:yes stop_codon:yes gene_type:complete
MKKIIMLFLMTTFCVTSMAQEVCLPPLVPFDVHRLDLENGYTHSTGGFANDTRVIEVDYIDNRKIVTNLFDSQGEVTLTNTPTQNTIARKVKYRHKVDIPKGDYTITQHATDYEVCVENGEVIFFTEAPIANGASYTIDWIYSVEIVRRGDLNNDGFIDGNDLGMLFAGWGMDGETDLNGDGITNGQDMGILFENWTG